MATQVQLRRGTSTQNDSFTGAQGELTFDTTNKRVRIHDGATAGGFELKTENAGGDTLFATGEKAIFGNGSDLQIYHDGANSYIQNITNSLIIQNDSDDKQVIIKSDNGSGGVADYFRANGTTGEALLYHYGSPKLATTTTGIDVTGTVNADGLTVERETALTYGSIDINGTNDSSIRMYNSAGTANFRKMDIRYSAATGYEGLYFRSINDANNDFNEIARFDTKTGDISFYEDTGTTAKFFWDASTERLGIGTASPDAPLHIIGNDGVQFNRSGQTNGFIIRPNASSDGIRFTQGGTGDRMIIDSSGNVGIGASPPTAPLDVLGRFLVNQNDGHAEVTIASIANRDARLFFKEGTTQRAEVYTPAGSSQLVVKTGTTEAMRIDSSGNLLVGKPSASYSTEGQEFRANGATVLGRSGAEPLTLNRISSDGGILNFRKDGSAVGSIGNASNNLVFYLAGTQNAVKLVGPAGGVDAFAPASTSGSNRDNAMDLGWSSNRFKDLYLSGGVVFDAVSGNATSNTLDDYEEGTWTPAIGTISGYTGAITVNGATYTKIGNLVTVRARLFFGSATGVIASGDQIAFTGLPFSAAAIGGFYDYNYAACTLNQGGVRRATMDGVMTGATTFQVTTTNLNSATNRNSTLIGISFSYRST